MPASAASLIAATLLGALAPATVVAGFGGWIAIMPTAMLVALGLTVLLGLPAFAVLASQGNFGPTKAMLTGFFVAAIPVGAMALLSASPWMHYVESMVAAGLLGVFGGFVFWLTLWCLGWFSQPNAVAAKTSMLVALILGGGALGVPPIIEGRNCHNMMRDGHADLPLQVLLEAPIPSHDWPKLTTLLRQLAEKHGLDEQDLSGESVTKLLPGDEEYITKLRDVDAGSPRRTRMLSIGLCTSSIGIHARGMQSSDSDATSSSRNRITVMRLYAPDESTAWLAVARELLDEIEAEWPKSLRYKDRQGQVTDRPDLR